MNRFSINKRLAAALLLPIVLIAVLSDLEILHSYNEYRRMDALVRTSSDLKIVTNVVDALQVERARSAGFLGSRGSEMREEMVASREATDAALDRFEAEAAALMTVDDERLQAHLSAVTKALQVLNSRRNEIDTQTIGREEAFDYYNHAVENLTDLMNDMSISEAAVHLASLIFAYNNIVQAKELAGRERGEGAGMIAAGHADQVHFDRFWELAGGSKAYFERFLHLQPMSRMAELSERLESAGAGDAKAIRARIMRGGVGADLSGLDAGEWYAMTTRVINVMNDMEHELLDEIGEIAQAESTTSWLYFLAATLVIFLTVLVVVGSSISLARSVTSPLRRLTQCMNNLAKGQTNMDLVDTSGEDEIAQMARAVSAFVVTTEQTAEERLRTEKERMREREFQQREIEAERAERARELEAAMAEVGGALRRLSSGDVSYRIQSVLPGSLDALRRDYNGSVEMLEQTIHAVKDVAESVERGVAELQVASDDLARRTEQQAAALETTSASMSEVSTAVQSSASRAGLAGKYVTEASEYARSSGALVDESVAVIEKIADSSREISQIVSVIDEIAFQTNLLALNAGVEAARAGEAGKGFAVVAQEVRDLAQRSGTAAHEIRSLIDRSVSSLDNGVALFERTGGALAGIREKVETVRAEVTAIVDASREQAESISHVNDTLSQMDTATQQNAAMVEEATAATHSLSKEAQVLGEQIAAFTLNSSRQMPVSRAA
ncbi:methyl-accepting chemotaxis protein [Jiella marina]|uniref:methyl-accepting chemotaxis protein n=1 Tax=Jiella sp. LLJ827 TaxID=2917712 RepID=UPI002100B3C0|nr:methyl-accepting chemotaxis protein [Jiella sp. LLJ827]MCQ0988558.1 methyl-accepting chemotaxis protein [Jiella sp. LLJ827]